MGGRQECAGTVEDHLLESKSNPDPVELKHTSQNGAETRARSERLTIKKFPSHIILPTLPSSPTATFQTTSPGRNNFDTPARFNCVSHSRTLESDNQSPSGEGTKTRSRGARRNLNRGERKGDPRCCGAFVWEVPVMWLTTADWPWCEWENIDNAGDGARLG